MSHRCASTCEPSALGYLWIAPEEVIKFKPRYAKRGDYIALKGSWAKGRPERTLLVATSEQGEMLKALELSNIRSLRHLYAQGRYGALPRWQALITGNHRRRQNRA